MSIEVILLISSVLLFLSVIASKATGVLGVPTLVAFLFVGMLAGSDGPGGLYYDNPMQAQALGFVALAFILFAGGMDTEWSEVREVRWKALSLATIGVVATTAAVGLFAHQFLGFKRSEGFLLGAIIASTDAAAVFGLFRSQSIALRKDVRALLEVESGSNDAVAVFLTSGLALVIAGKLTNPVTLLPSFLMQMPIGLAMGYVVGRAGVFFMRKLRLEFDALYHVISIVVVLFAFSATSLAGGNGFLAVYVAGLTYGAGKFHQKKGLRKFHDGMAWLLQIAMFLVLGLLVFPHKLLSVIGPGIAVAAFLMLVARPIGVFLSLAPLRVEGKVIALVSWTGLRGAVPIVLATYPKVLGLERADDIFNIVFFVVLLSALLQGTTLPWLSRKLNLVENETILGP